jgi:hypothetical protein
MLSTLAWIDRTNGSVVDISFLIYATLANVANIYIYIYIYIYKRVCLGVWLWLFFKVFFYLEMY